MITATIENNEILTTGDVKEGDNYPGFCCTGFDWEVRAIVAGAAWGVCGNRDCPVDRDSECWRGVSFIDLDDLAEWLAERNLR